MTDLQLPLDFVGRARSRDPQTSKEAGLKVNANGISARVLESLRQDGPASSHELAARLRMSLVTVSPRLRPLAKAGWVREKKRLDGQTEKRDGCIVWEAI